MTTLYDDHPAMFRNHPVGFVISVALIPVLIGVLILAIWYLRTKSSRLIVTEESIVHETGLLNKDNSEIAIDSIRSVRVSASFLDRILGVGTISLFSAGDEAEIVISGMRDPNSIRDFINQGKVAHRDRSG